MLFYEFVCVCGGGGVQFSYCTDQQNFVFVPRANLVTLSNAIFIDRKNHKKAIESTTQAVTDMKKHNVISAIKTPCMVLRQSLAW